MCKSVETEGLVDTTAEAKPRGVPVQDWSHRIRCVIMIVLLQCLLPFSLFCMFCTLVRFKVRQLVGLEKEAPAPTGPVRTVLLTGGKMTKALQLARAIKRSSARTRVVLVETEKFRFCGSRFSNCVDEFVTVRCPRRDGGEAYCEDLVDLFREYAVDLFLPVSSPAAAVWDSAAKARARELQLQTHCVHFDPAVTDLLDDKDAFGRFCRETLDMADSVPETCRVASDEEARAANRRLAKSQGEFILKNLEYDPIHRLDLFKLPCPEKKLNAYLAKIRMDGNPITAQAPWQVQQFVRGEEFSAFAVVRRGQLQVLTVCESSPSQLNYRHVDVPAIEAWVHRFVDGCREKQQELEGQLCWDFLVDQDGKAWPIECNPRVHSQICVYRPMERELGDVLVFGNAATPIVPPNSNKHGPNASKPEDYYWMYNEFFKMFPNNALLKYQADEEAPALVAKLRAFLRTLLTEQEVDLDPRDPLPFLLRNHLQLPMLLLDTLAENNEWKKLDFNIGKVVEKGGD
jgi:hypothetical protein